jgi:hypothetical protein
MPVALPARVKPRPHLFTTALIMALAAPALSLGATDTAKADANRRKPLQRCGELKDDAQLQCLQQARERVVEERRKREAQQATKGEGKRQSAK